MKLERDITIYVDQAILKRLQANEISLSIVLGKSDILASAQEYINEAEAATNANTSNLQKSYSTITE